MKRSNYLTSVLISVGLTSYTSMLIMFGTLNLYKDTFFA
jgi:hypothetical protein